MIRRLGLLAAVLFAVACATPQGSDRNEDGLRDTPSGRYAGALGDSPVGVIPDVTLRDETRTKDILINIDYPTRGGSHPLIVFSPGLGQTQRAYVGLASSWASNGYVVVRVAHADANRSAATAGAPATPTPADWRNRVRDVTFVLDSLATLEQRYPELEAKIDRTRIGVGGHGWGAFTAMLAGGVRTFPGAVSYADPRVKAVVAMSPPGPGAARGLTDESWSELRVPTLFMTGTRDSGADDSETPEWRRSGFTLSPAGDKWLVVLEGARTASFTGRIEDVVRSVTAEEEPTDPNRPRDARSVMPPRTREEVSLSASERSIFNRVKGLSLAFWDVYLKGEKEGRTALEQGFGSGVETK